MVHTFESIMPPSDMKRVESNQDSQNAILGRSTAGLAAKEGGHAIELSGTILAMRQTVFI